MMTGGFSIHGDLVTLSRHRLPGARGHRRGRRHRPAGLGARHQAGRPAGRCIRIPHPRRTFRPGCRVQGRQPDLADRRAVGQVDRRHRRHARRRHADGAAARRAQRKRCLVQLAGGAQHRRRDRDGVQPGPVRGRRGRRGQQVRADAGRRDVRTLPRLARLGQINDHTRISLGRIMSEQARDMPGGECLLFDGRVHTYEAVDRRINNVVRGLIEVGVRQGAHVGVLMETRPSALVAIAALSRLGAVAVLMPPDADLATAARIGGGVGDHRRPEQPRGRPPARHAGAGARRRRIARPGPARARRRRRHGEDRPRRRRPARLVPAQPRAGPRPGFRRVQLRSAATSSPARSPTTAGRCRRSAPRRPPTSAAATPSTASPRCTTSPGCWSASAVRSSAGPASRCRGSCGRIASSRRSASTA